MRPLKRDPAPSRWRYRYQRLMLTPAFRKLLRVGLPVAVVGGLFGSWLAHEENRLMLSEAWGNIVYELQHREQFMVHAMAVDGADEALSQDIREVLPLDFPLSTFELDLEEMRQTVAAIPAVAEAGLRVKPGGILQVTVSQRQPVAVFRDAAGLRLIDAEGVIIAPLTARAERADLPLITGDGARETLAEGLALYGVAGPVLPRMRAVVRMGERRWDVVLDRGQRVLLPTEDPIAAFERVIALDQAKDLLERDVSVVDMRNAHRPTIRLNEPAVAELRRISGPAEEGDQ